MKVTRVFDVKITVEANLTEKEYKYYPPLKEWENDVKSTIEDELFAHSDKDRMTFKLEIESKETCCE